MNLHQFEDHSKRNKFYKECIDIWIKNKDAKVLIVAGWTKDKDIFHSLGFKNVVISNLAQNLDPNYFDPYSFSYQDAQDLKYEDNSFDYVIVHAALHHLHSPHKGLLEMYRVSSKGCIVFEARDSLFMRFVGKLNTNINYEISAIQSDRTGGLDNGEIPNYVYRWNEREIEKTIQSNSPYFKHKINYQYANAVAKFNKIFKSKNIIEIIIFITFQLYKVSTLIFKKQNNLFAFFVEKDNNNLFPWLKKENSSYKFIK